MFGLGNLASLLGNIDPRKLKGILDGLPGAGGGVQAQQPNGGMLANISGPSNPVASEDGKVNISAKPAQGGGGFGGMLSGFIGEAGSDQRRDLGRSLLSMGASMMQAGGPSFEPTDTFATLGKGIQAGADAYTSTKEGRAKRGYLEAQTARYGVQNQSDLAEMNRTNTAAGLASSAASGAGAGGGDRGYVEKMFQSAVARGDNAGINYWGQRLRDPAAIAAENATESFGTASGTLAANAPKNAADDAQRLDKENTDNVTSLRQNWTQGKTYNDFANISRARAQAGALLENPSATAYQSLVYDFAKIKDPGSAVMDGERQMILGTSSLPDQYTSWFNRAQSGEAPPRHVMESLVKTIDDNYQAAREQYVFARDQGAEFAKSIKLDPTRIYSDPAPMIPRFQTQQERDVAASTRRSAPAAAPTVGAPRQTAAPAMPAPAPAAAPSQSGKAFVDISGMTDAEARKRYPAGTRVIRDGRRGVIR